MPPTEIAPPTFLHRCLGEVVGTYLLVLFGCGAVHAAVLMGAQSGLWQIAIVWGVAIALAIYAVGALSGAHINPAMTIAFAAFGRFPKALVVPYVFSQLVGAFLAAAALYGLFSPYLAQREHEKQVVRGAPGSVVTAMCYGEYFPSPGGLSQKPGPLDPAELERHWEGMSEARAWGAEFLGTAILALLVFAMTDPGNASRPAEQMVPVFIGLTVAALISVIAPLTQACFNPARDFGPRLFAYCAGWKAAALPGPTPTGWLTVYILAPIAGALAGAALYETILRRRPPITTGTNE